MIWEEPTMAGLPVRKKNRLQTYDYQTPGYYFLTFCTADRACLLGYVTEADETRPSRVVLSDAGIVVEESIRAIPDHYAGVLLDKYVIMPNHVHMILVFQDTGRPCPAISRIVQQLKGVITKRLGKNIWQIHFHDHVIRGETDYREIWEYIDNNPAKWALDRYYQP